MQKGKGINKDKSETIAQIANGNLNKAIQLCQIETEDPPPLKYFQKWMQICYKANLKELVIWTEEMAKRGRENV